MKTGNIGTLLACCILLTVGSCQQQEQLSGHHFPVSENSELPYLTTHDGKLYASWVERGKNQASLFYSRLESKWTEPELIAQGNNWFVNWADYPMIAVQNESILAHYLQKSTSGTYSYDVTLVQKGTNWSSPFHPHSDGTPTEHGFVTMLPLADGTTQIAWLDGRYTADGGAMTLRTAAIGKNQEIVKESELDNKVCDCCQTSGALTKNGPVFFYRDRTEAEIRDIAIVRKTAEGWTSPTLIAEDNWKIAGCPVNGPRADAIENNIAVAWYTAANTIPKVKVVFSRDGGISFSPPIVIDDTNPIGRVDVALLDMETAIVTWLDQDDGASIKGRKVTMNGQFGNEVAITTTSEARNSGFPQLEVIDRTIFAAWTDTGSKKIRMTVLSEDDF